MDLGETRAPAHVLLDGRPVCVVTAASPGCTVDLGPDPRVHLLELLRTDPAGHVTERQGRWINRPGIEPEVVASGSCDEQKHDCAFDLTWAHPGKLDPKRLVLYLDAAKVWEGTQHHARVVLQKGSKPQVVVLDAEFPDGTRATYTRTLYAFYPEEAQASLLAVPIVPEAGAGEALSAALAAAGLPVRAVEETSPEVTFVMDWQGLDGIVESVSSARRAYSVPMSRRWPAESSKAFDQVQLVFPEESLPAVGIALSRLGAVRSPAGVSRFSRYSDAVAAAGYTLGGLPKRRAVVLILSGFDRPNISSFTPAQAQAYLAEVMVPLIVWRVGNVVAPEWPDGPRLVTKADLLNALQQVRSEIDRQRIVWLEGLQDTRYLGRWLAPGVALAGREASATAVGPSVANLHSPSPSVRSIGPDGGPVHALASAAEGSVSYAGTHAGVFRSRDGGARWEAASAGLPGVPVRCLAVAPDSSVVLAGTDAGLFRSADSAEHWERSEDGLAASRVSAVAIDVANPRVLYAAAEGRGVLRSDDGGRTLLASAMDHGDVRALAVDPRDHSVLAASERGVFLSRDRGMTWAPAANVPARVLALAIEAGSGRIFAGTAGEGLLVSRDGGGTWTKTALRRTYVTGVRLDPDSARILAASPDGILSSTDGGATWKLARVDAVEALAVLDRGVVLAGGVRGVLRHRDSVAGWRESSEGLTAQIVFSAAVAAGPPSVLYAGTTLGLMRAVPGASGWDSVPGIPEGVAAYAIALRGAASPELLLGTSGSVGRSSDHGGSWSWSASHGAFSLSVDGQHPDLALVATREGVFRSEDGGAHWSSPASGLERTFALEIAADPKNPSVVYAATAGSGVLRSADGARSWSPGSRELSRRIVRSLAVDAAANAIVYAGTDSGVFRSLDAGREWAPVSDGLARVPVYALLADPRSPGTIYAGTATGLFRTTDGGASWTGLPASDVGAVVTSLWLDTGRDELVAGTYGAGVFVVPLGSGPAASDGLH